MARLSQQMMHPAAGRLQRRNPLQNVTDDAKCVCALSLQGLIPRLMRIPPGQAIVWAVSDQITGHFERRRMEAAVGP